MAGARGGGRPHPMASPCRSRKRKPGSVRSSTAAAWTTCICTSWPCTQHPPHSAIPSTAPWTAGWRAPARPGPLSPARGPATASPWTCSERPHHRSLWCRHHPPSSAVCTARLSPCPLHCHVVLGPSCPPDAARTSAASTRHRFTCKSGEEKKPTCPSPCGPPRSRPRTSSITASHDPIWGGRCCGRGQVSSQAGRSRLARTTQRACSGCISRPPTASASVGLAGPWNLHCCHGGLGLRAQLSLLGGVWEVADPAPGGSWSGAVTGWPWAGWGWFPLACVETWTPLGPQPSAQTPSWKTENSRQSSSFLQESLLHLR
uniref:FERM domain containing 1 n=1 Tax=Pongo abelii TaxID=9601 RepID=A0A8I5UIA7_PONAB